MYSRYKVRSILIAENPQYRGLENRVFWSRCAFELSVSVTALSFFLYYFLAEGIFVIKFLSCASVIYGSLFVAFIAAGIGFVSRVLYSYWREKKKTMLLVACRNQHLFR